jgi:lipase chaperone LimK
MPEEFWMLTMREFWIKHAAFNRAENRARSLVLEHASIIGQFKDKDRNALRKSVNLLRQYPAREA